MLQTIIEIKAKLGVASDRFARGTVLITPSCQDPDFLCKAMHHNETRTEQLFSEQLVDDEGEDNKRREKYVNLNEQLGFRFVSASGNEQRITNEITNFTQHFLSHAD
jgi:hypothetical protein